MSFKKACGVFALSVFAAVLGMNAAQAGPLADATKDSLWGIELGGIWI